MKPYFETKLGTRMDLKRLKNHPKCYYSTDNGVLLYGGCIELMPELEPMDLILTDPPYGINWNCDYSKWIKKGPNTQGGDKRRSYPQIYGDDKPFNLIHLLVYKNVIIWGALYFLSYLENGIILVWHKRNSTFLAQAEAAWMNRGKGVYVYTELVEKIQKDRKHSTQKSIGLMQWCIEKSKTKGTILDPYLGAGTTGIACERMGRNWIGIEISEQYCEISKQRISREIQQTKMF